MAYFVITKSYSEHFCKCNLGKTFKELTRFFFFVLLLTFMKFHNAFVLTARICSVQCMCIDCQHLFCTTYRYCVLNYRRAAVVDTMYINFAKKLEILICNIFILWVFLRVLTPVISH